MAKILCVAELIAELLPFIMFFWVYCSAKWLVSVTDHLFKRMAVNFVAIYGMTLYGVSVHCMCHLVEVTCFVIKLLK